MVHWKQYYRVLFPVKCSLLKEFGQLPFEPPTQWGGLNFHQVQYKAKSHISWLSCFSTQGTCDKE